MSCTDSFSNLTSQDLVHRLGHRRCLVSRVMARQPAKPVTAHDAGCSWPAGPGRPPSAGDFALFRRPMAENVSAMAYLLDRILGEEAVEAVRRGQNAAP